MLLAGIYRHPNSNVNAFHSKLCDLLMEIKSKIIDCFICGDIKFNTLRTDDKLKAE